MCAASMRTVRCGEPGIVSDHNSDGRFSMRYAVTRWLVRHAAIKISPSSRSLDTFVVVLVRKHQSHSNHNHESQQQVWQSKDCEHQQLKLPVHRVRVVSGLRIREDADYVVGGVHAGDYEPAENNKRYEHELPHTFPHRKYRISDMNPRINLSPQIAAVSPTPTIQ